MEKDFEVVKEGTTLNVILGKELSMGNSAVLTEELAKYYGQGIQKVVFDATGLFFLASSGIRAVIYANQRLGGKTDIVFVNCAKEINDVLALVGLTSFIKFEESQEKRVQYRRRSLSNLDSKEIEQHVSERDQVLDNYAANNDVVCYSMRIGQDDD